MKITGPGLGFDASGTFGGVLVFSKWKGINYGRLRVTPYNPKSNYQVGIRNTVTWGVLYWKGAYVAAAQKTWWNTYAEGMGMSGFNRFMKYFVAGNYQALTGTFQYTGIPHPE